MKWMFLLLACTLIIPIACRKLCACDPVQPSPFFVATVINTAELACKKPLLRFKDTVASELNSFLGNGNNHLEYVAVNLPNSLNILGKEVTIEVSNITPATAIACTDIGPGYPQLYVVRAK